MTNKFTPLETQAMDLLCHCITTGHFKLSSGLHSDTYFQMASLFEDPHRAEQVVELFIKKNSLTKDMFDMVVSPAMGGILVGYEVARQLGISNVFFERVNGTFTLRRGFSIPDKSRILLMEDVITTGKSYGEVIQAITNISSDCTIKTGCVVDRTSNQMVDFSVINLEPKLYSPDSCVLCKSNIEVSTLGSRFI